MPLHILTLTHTYIPLPSLPLHNQTNSSADKTIKIWDLSARAAVSTVQDTGEVWSVAWRPSVPALGAGAGAFVSGGEDGVVRWWRGAGAGV